MILDEGEEGRGRRLGAVWGVQGEGPDNGGGWDAMRGSLAGPRGVV